VELRESVNVEDTQHSTRVGASTHTGWWPMPLAQLVSVFG
jgi:hypothetical protein